jgi:3-oxoacyl-[acyl-carrier-protein] synthase II
MGAVATVHALDTGTVPPTINVTTVGEDIEVDVATTVRRLERPAAVLNSFGFGGHNATAVFSRA